MLLGAVLVCCAWLAAGTIKPSAQVPAQGQASEQTQRGALDLAVNRAIARGVQHLRRAQLDSGSWPGQEDGHPGGMAALCGYALVKSGVSRNDDSVRRALQYVLQIPFKSTYSQAVRLLFLESMRDPNTWRDRARSGLDFLISAQDQATGCWAYPWGGVDMSNTQFALLGLRAAHSMDLDVPEETLAKCVNGLLRWRNEAGQGWNAEDGGFGYTAGREATGGMTAATLAGLAVLTEVGRDSPVVQSALRRNAKVIASAEDWLETRFRVDGNPVGAHAWTPSFHYAHLWALERWCGLSGRGQIGGRDWYAEGARWLIEQQRFDGGWGRSLDETCFALLFLRRATVTSDRAPEADLSDFGEAPPRKRQPSAPAAEVAYITDWLLAGPWPTGTQHEEIVAPPFDASKQRPKEKAKLTNRVFERVKLNPRGWTNLEELTKRGGDHLLWALSTTIEWRGPSADVARAENQAPEHEALLWFAFEDGWNVHFDGKQVSVDQRVGAAIEESVCVPIRLTPGEHTLFVLVEDDLGASAFSARISDPAGYPLGESVSVWAVAPKPGKAR